MILNKKAIANSATIATGVMYLLFYILGLVMPEFFKFLYTLNYEIAPNRVADNFR